MILFLTGQNDFAIKQTVDDLTARFVSKFGQAGLERIDGEQLPPARLSELLQGASLFAVQRLVVLRGASANRPLWEALGDWLESQKGITTDLTLIVVEPASDKRTRTFKQLKKYADVKEFGQLNPTQLTHWLQKMAAAQGCVLDGPTAAYLVQQVGSDQWRLWQELQKLLDYQNQPNEAAVDLLVEPNPQASAFDMLDAAIARQSNVVEGLLRNLAITEDPYRLFGLLISQVHSVAIVHSAGSRSADVIAKEAGIHPFVVRKMQATTRTMNTAELQQIIRDIAKLDTQLKSTGSDPWVLLRQCLGKIVAR